MGHYKVNSANSTDFILTADNFNIGELKYSKWYSFKAKMLLADNSFLSTRAERIVEFKD